MGDLFIFFRRCIYDLLKIISSPVVFLSFYDSVCVCVLYLRCHRLHHSTHRSRLASNNKDLLTCVLTYSDTILRG